MLPPHHHPRADNFVVLTASNPNASVDTYMIQENDAPVIKQNLQPLQMTIFPRGSLHTMVNTGCGNVQLVSSLNAENAGTLNAANNFYRLNDQIIGTVLGATGSQLNATMNNIPAIGTGSNAGSAECLSKCGLS
ncbi:hypothetical protein EV356DRAFT_496147 [Viridothelium virens]|uniref:Cupin type-1 domain-containing protein n=1 Tax=Viridothelium virens TaxID=1048519 RepID=A0A6A6HHK1_VIRVR|nr:hypothetical protein EV356DRAFT_496147 [Viridothelium virens]